MMWGVWAAVALLVLFLALIFYARHLAMSGIVERLEQMYKELEDHEKSLDLLHDGEPCPQERRVGWPLRRVRNCDDCEAKWAEYHRHGARLIKELPKPIVAIGMLSMFWDWILGKKS